MTVLSVSALTTISQAKSNVDPCFRDVLDPEITQVGMQQARELSRTFPHHGRIEAVFSSPLQRALHTALIAFGENKSMNDRIIALPLAQETSHALCDTGRHIDALKKTFPESKVDYQYIVPDWNSKTGKWSQEDVAVNDRAAALRDFLARRPEREVVLITHGFFLHFLTEVGRMATCVKLVTNLISCRIGLSWREAPIVSSPRRSQMPPDMVACNPATPALNRQSTHRMRGSAWCCRSIH